MSVSMALRTGLNFLKLPQLSLLCVSNQLITNAESVRHIQKHWNPKFKKLRKAKVMKIKLPDFEEDNGEFTQEKLRKKMKEQGLLPPRPWAERAFAISSTGVIFEPYVPPEGDGKLSVVTGGGAKQKLQLLEKKSKSMMSVRKIRSFDEDFNTTAFANTAQDIYIKAHNCMISNDRLNLREVVTEKCYPEILHNTRRKTIHWKFIKSLEPPRVVHCRCTSIVTKENIFAQVTVRFHTQQQLAVYDRFGRLMHGSEIIAKDVLEYVVFEKHLANVYGIWRMHSKIIPDWMPPKEPSSRTFVQDDSFLDVGLSKHYVEKEVTTAGVVPPEDKDNKLQTV